MAEPHAGFDQILGEIGVEIGVDLTPDEHGVITLTTPGDVTVTIEAPDSSRFLYFHSPVKRLTGLDHASALAAAMKRNLFDLPLSASWLALDASEDLIILCYSIPREGLQAVRLTNTIEAIAVAVRELRHESTMADSISFSEVEMSSGADFIRI